MDSLIARLGIEVRQAVHNVTGLLELMAEEPVSENQSQYLSRCRESADQLLRTSNDLAELARSPAVPSRPKPFQVAEAVGEIAELMSVLALRKALEFDYAVDSSVPLRIIGDKDLLQDILHRLLDNAVRFTESGSVRLLVTAAEQGAERVMLTFEIADTGPGIAEEIFFSKFESLLSGGPLHGLGLLVVRNSLAGIGGGLSMVSTSALGTTLRITIPTAIAQIDTARVAATAPLPGIARSQLRLLVAEDSNDSFLLFQSYVKSEGHQVTRARNGAEAVELAKSGEHNFVVMDVHMPIMDGYTATRVIREWETEHGGVRLPILLLSADDLATQIRIGAAAGCSGYLAKPTNKRQVLAALGFYANPVPVRDLS